MASGDWMNYVSFKSFQSPHESDEEQEYAPAFKTLCQSEAIYLDGIRHTLGDEHLSSLVKLKEIYDRRSRAVAEAAFRLGYEWRMKQELVWGARNDD